MKSLRGSCVARLFALAAFAFMAFAFIMPTASDAATPVRIVNDPGGQIGPYFDKFSRIRDYGQHVVIDGPCLSACTMVLGLVPEQRICVTPRAKLGFHAAWDPTENGGTKKSNPGTRMLWKLYPEQIRSWLNRQGGLKKQMVYLSGRELAAMYQTCQ